MGIWVRPSNELAMGCLRLDFWEENEPDLNCGSVHRIKTATEELDAKMTSWRDVDADH